ncbi:hypothetical protein JHK87_010491 [Glycine soja]|nr:hypothetical protein JHK87_010491 [Glycine soja]
MIHTIDMVQNLKLPSTIIIRTPTILSRKPHLDDEIYNELVQRAKDVGYDVSKLHKTPQSDPPPEEEGPQDTRHLVAQIHFWEIGLHDDI